MTSAAPLSLVADIGGTNTRVGLARAGQLLPETIRRFRNADNSGLDEILRRYLADSDIVECEGVCIAVAGPVRGTTATLTNLDWTIDNDTLRRASGARRVAIINDLQAQGQALGHIAPDHLRSVLKGTGASGATAQTRLVIGVGTGFNAAPVYETPQGRYVAPSECGHETLPIRTADDLSLSRFVEASHGFTGVEDVLSGRGLERVYNWVAEVSGAAPNRGAAEIMEGAAAGEALSCATLTHFIRLLGTVAGNLALVHLPFGGIYLCGGVARAVGPYLAPMGFDAAFHDKGRFSDYLRQFSVWIVEDDYAALTGCALYLARD